MKYNLSCKCNLYCYNCGVLDTSDCKCQCKNGWDSFDCSKVCQDENRNCTYESCEIFDLEEKHPCRKTCGFCRNFEEHSNNSSCDEKREEFIIKQKHEEPQFIKNNNETSTAVNPGSFTNEQFQNESALRVDFAATTKTPKKYRNTHGI
ncbi:uncharacterized protein [Centruroides vittatus]|uniref:uncharacterized protein n=1 Tax=Centruroides vittatus TaxID=120091 RepID=UPI00351010D0